MTSNRSPPQLEPLEQTDNNNNNHEHSIIGAQSTTSNAGSPSPKKTTGTKPFSRSNSEANFASLEQSGRAMSNISQGSPLLARSKSGGGANFGNSSPLSASQSLKPPPVAVSDLELENIRRIFKQFDADGSNTIDVEELSLVMTSLGVQMDQEQLRQLVEQVTNEGEQELTFDEFVSLITLWKEAAQYKLFEGDGFKSLAKQHVEAALESESLIPDSPFRAFWDSLVCFVAVLYWIFVLLLDAYSVDGLGHHAGLISGDVICTLFLIGDVIICSRTAFSRDGKTIDDLDEVFQNYKKTWMAPDILASIPFDLVFNLAGLPVVATVLRHFRLLKLLKLPSLWKTSDVVPITSGYITFHFHLLPIFQLCVTFILMVHGFAIGWILLKQQNCNDPLVTFTSASDPTSCVYPYTPAIYFVVYTLSTVGLGDIKVKGQSEHWYACAVLVGAMASNGIVIGKLVQILQRADIKKEQRSKLRETLAVLEHYHIATQLQTEILQFQAHVFENNLGAAYEGIVSDLPAEMRTNISLFVRMKLVSVVPIFHQSHFMLRIAVAQALTNAVARPEQYMCVAGQKIEGLYFLAYGFADTFDQKGQYKQTLRSGDFFGDESLIGNGVLNESVKALTYCDMWILDSVTFESLLDRFPKFRRTVELLRSIDEEQQQLCLQKATSTILNMNKEHNNNSKNAGREEEEQKKDEDEINPDDRKTPPSKNVFDNNNTNNNNNNNDDPSTWKPSSSADREGSSIMVKPVIQIMSASTSQQQPQKQQEECGESSQQQNNTSTEISLSPSGRQQQRRRSVVTFQGASVTDYSRLAGGGDGTEEEENNNNDESSQNNSSTTSHNNLIHQQNQNQEDVVTVGDMERFLRQVRKFKKVLKSKTN